MAKDSFYGPLERVNDFCWRIPKSYKPGMRVDGLIYADDQMIELIRKDQAPEQVANVAFLPGIQHASLAMPDIHWGYGFCIGGGCAPAPHGSGGIPPGGGAVLSRGGCGATRNGGGRRAGPTMCSRGVKPHLAELMDQLFANTPAGV